jgi:hypothetical protein
MTFGIPQVIFLMLTAIGLWIELDKHGKVKTGRHNIFSTLIAEVLIYSLLWWGGFFG